ncbi:hypothetical protein PXV46_14550 (plasmid) [Staphylococcus aureus]|nr:hypothetical protein [Staphylococcus aureus]WEF94844.1 hypothetical protein PXV46_14550 [Staphylococcus aureus]
MEEVKSVTILEKLNRLSELENDVIATLDMICYILSNKINLIREKEDIEHDLMLARKQDDSSDNPRKTSLTLEPKDNGKD